MTEPFCADCPDHEACHQGLPCDFVRQVEQAFQEREERLKGRTVMASNKNEKSPVDELIAQANLTENTNKQEKTVPTQTTAETASDAQTTDGEKEPKKTPGQRLDSMIAKAKEKKKLLMGIGAGVGVGLGVAVVAFVKASAKTLVETEPVEDEAVSVQPLDEALAEGPVVGVDA